MAQHIILTSGSILNGSPITLSVKPNIISGELSFHRIILEIKCGMTEVESGDYEIIKMSSPVEAEDGKDVTIDISSALRTFRDSYEYTPTPSTYPIVKFNIKTYDEYMIKGEVRQTSPIYYPQNPEDLPADRRDEAYMRTLFGKFPDIIRLTTTTGYKTLTTLTQKPKTTPQIVAIGETLAYTPPYDTEQQLIGSHTLIAPQSKATEVKKEGLQTLGYQTIYALPSTEAINRQVFRFINTFGVLESISTPSAYSKNLNIKSTPYILARQETFNQFSRSAIRKHSNNESWHFKTDPLDESWIRWYLHEFLMSEYIWIAITPTSTTETIWLPCTITPEEDITFIDHTKTSEYTLTFTAKFDLNGSPVID